MGLAPLANCCNCVYLTDMTTLSPSLSVYISLCVSSHKNISEVHSGLGQTTFYQVYTLANTVSLGVRVYEHVGVTASLDSVDPVCDLEKMKERKKVRE